MQNFFGEEIEKTVFISDDQVKDNTIRELYGRFYVDTYIFNVFPEALNDRGDLLCTVLVGFCKEECKDKQTCKYELEEK